MFRHFLLSSGADVWPIFAVLLIGGVIVAVFCSRIPREDLLLIEDWARLHQFTVISVRRSTIVPFWRIGPGYLWFRVAIKDVSGTARYCRLRIRFFSNTPDSIEVIWDKIPSA
jgi:hypothetical protein